MCVWVYVYVCVCVHVRVCVCVCVCVCCDEGWITVAKPPAIVLFLCLPKCPQLHFLQLSSHEMGKGGGGGGAQFMLFIVVCSYKALCNEHC